MKRNTKWIWIAAGAGALMIATRIALLYWTDPVGPWSWADNMPMGGWMMPAGMLGTGLFWIVIVIIVARSFSERGCGMHDAAGTRLKERLANGDITIEEYETLRNKLKEER